MFTSCRVIQYYRKNYAGSSKHIGMPCTEEDVNDCATRPTNASVYLTECRVTNPGPDCMSPDTGNTQKWNLCSSHTYTCVM
jgi:hypothetical protein